MRRSIYATRSIWRFALDMRCIKGNARTSLIGGAIDSCCRRQHIECERSEHISIARNASKYRVAEQHIDTPKVLHIEFAGGEYIDKKKGL